MWSEDEVLSRPKPFPVSKTSRRYKRFYREQSRLDKLTFEEFAALKAAHVIDEAGELLGQTERDKGYFVTDTKIDYGFKLVLRNGERPLLEIIGFDLEYYLLRPEGAAQISRSVEASNQNGLSAKLRARDKIYHERPIARAASYAILERTGLSLPPQAESNLVRSVRAGVA
jgi:hypothetical protein